MDGMAEKAAFWLRRDPEGTWRIKNINSALASLCGYRAAELTDQPLVRVWSNVGPAFIGFCTRVAVHGMPDVVEYWVTTPKGEQCLRMVVAPDVDAPSRQLLATVTDLTLDRLQQRRQEDVLVTVKDVLWSMSVPELSMDFIGRSVTANFGYTVEEFMADPHLWEHIVHIDDREKTRQAIEYAILSGYIDHEHRVVLDNGEVRWIRNRMRAVRDKSGKTIRLDGAATDITDRKTTLGSPLVADDSLYYRHVVNQQMDPVIRYRLDLTVTFCNAAYANLYGKEPVDLIGKKLSEIIDPSELPHIYRFMDELKLGLGPVQSELRKVMPDGSIRWIRWTDVLSAATEGQEAEVQAVGHDITDRKEIEAALKESRKRFSLAATGMNDGIWDWDLLREEIWFSGRLKEQLGYEDEELPNDLQVWKELIDPEDYEAMQQQIEAYRAGQLDRIDIVQRYRNKEGAIVHIHCRAVGDRDANGEVIRLVGANTDVTRLIQAESRLKDAIDVISDGFVLFDPNDRIILHNDQFLYTPALREHGDLTGVSFTEIAHYFAMAEITDIKARQDPRSWIEWRIHRHKNPPADGYEQQLTDGRWIRIIERRTAEGGYVGIWTDITALKQAEIRLREAIESINEGFLLLDHDMKVVMCNDRLRQLYPISGVMLKPGALLMDVLRYAAEHGEYPGVTDIETFLTESLSLLRPDKPIVYERALAGGRWVLASQRRSTNGDIVGVRTDITSQKQREAELHAARNAADEANAAKSRFLAHMSHELRTPLNAILGFADVMRKGVFGKVEEPKYQQYLTFIYESGHHLLSLINDILDISKVEAGKRELQLEKIDAATLIDACLQVVAGLAKSKQVYLRYRIEPDAQYFSGDLRAVKQIIINLLSNAVKFTPPNGEVKAEVSKSNAYTIIEVSDTGIGMEEANIAKAFDPFGQIDSDLARTTEGTGLGLALVKSLVELHHGRIEVESAPNLGTMIRVFLPSDPALERSSQPTIFYRPSRKEPELNQT